MESIELNGRTYRLPARPTVVICADGCDPSYLEAGIAAGVLPTIAGFRDGGFYGLADAAMPTFTNPNNISIVTGVSPSVHGIAGNFALDRDTGAEIMMTDPAMVRTPTLLALMSQAGVPTAAITAKDKLRRMLGHDVAMDRGGICFSSEQADTCTLAEHGIDGVEALV
jgi:phosphonoacetate hydrolase